MEEPHPQPERRSQARYALDAEASLVIVHQGAAVGVRVFELSLDGCRVRVDRQCSLAMPASVEVIFRINGIGFRLAGTMQWLDSGLTAGIHFSPMAPRRREAIEGLLDELEAEKQAEQCAESQAQATAKAESTAADPDPRANAAVLSMPATPRRVDAPGTRSTRGTRSARPAEIQPVVPISMPPLKPAEPTGKADRGDKALSRPVGRDRRGQARYCLDTGATVFFIDVHAQIPARTVDLSMNGCRIRTGERFPVGIYRRVETEFKVDGLPFRLSGVVQSLHDKFTVGIRFLDMSPRKREQLAQLIEEMEEMQETGNRE